MDKKKIIEIANYCSEHECPMNITLKSGEQKYGTALHLVNDEFLFIKSFPKIKTDLIEILEIDKAECALGHIR